MKSIVAGVVALSVLAGVTIPADAFDARMFWEQQEHFGRESHQWKQQPQ